MKKKTIFISVMVCLILIFSSLSVFANDFSVIGGADGPTSIFIADAGEEGTEFTEEELESVLGHDIMASLILFTVSCIFSCLSVPALVVMIIFIVKNNKAKKDIKEFEIRFGPLNNNVNGYYGQPQNNSTPVNPYNNMGGQM